MSVTLTVFFESPFHVGVLERAEDGKISAARMVFGAEPSDQQVYDWVLAEFFNQRFSPGISVAAMKPLAANPKRRQRQATKAVDAGVGTKAQQGIQLGREAMKLEHRHLSREQREQDEQRKFALRQDKKKAKHRGH